MADNMCLPFADGAFNAYISNLSLMITQKPERQIVEAYRVLKPGSKACFSIWGRDENCQQFMIPRKALANLGRELPPAPYESYFQISKEKDLLRQKFIDAGFAEDVRMWYQPSNWFWRTSEEFYNQFCGGKDDPEFKTEVMRLYDEETKLGGMRTFEMLMILVFKD